MNANKWPTYTLSSTNDGAPVLSNRKDVVTILNGVVSNSGQKKGGISLQRGGQWLVNMDSSNVPFLTACYTALFGGSASTKEDGVDIRNDDAMLYWISLVENMDGGDNGGSSGGGGGGGGSGRDHNGATSPSLLETEVVRLRVLLHEAREEAEKWKNLVENSLSQ